MPLFICRWQNGDFSAVSARSRKEAVTLLDEIGNAELGELFTVNDFMVHFRLKDMVASDGDMTPVELQQFGEMTHDMLFERLYPEYAGAACAPEGTNSTDLSSSPAMAVQRLNRALELERSRQKGRKSRELSKDAEVARLQMGGLDTPKVIAERVVKERKRRLFTELPLQTNAVH